MKIVGLLFPLAGAQNIEEISFGDLNLNTPMSIKNCKFDFGDFLFAAVCRTSEDAYKEDRFENVGIKAPRSQLYIASL